MLPGSGAMNEEYLERDRRRPDDPEGVNDHA
jgi:hypothetical protein